MESRGYRQNLGNIAYALAKKDNFDVLSLCRLPSTVR